MFHFLRIFIFMVWMGNRLKKSLKLQSFRSSTIGEVRRSSMIFSTLLIFVVFQVKVCFEFLVLHVKHILIYKGIHIMGLQLMLSFD
jgi:hypothetical protein